jgi:molybdopterin molybdotransferase
MLTDRPDPDFCGCDLPAGARPGLVSLDTAIGMALSLATPVPGVESLPLEQAIGRVLAQAVHSPLPQPPFDNAAMDGYALSLGDLAGAGPWLLPVAGRIAAGEGAEATRPRGTALRILTGAPVPPDCDAVVMQEHVRRRGDAILIEARPAPGLNVRRRGEDLEAGAEMVAAGRLVGAREAAAIAATGAAEVCVRRRVRVAFLCSGSELRQPGEPLAPGQIYNSNRFGLLGALAQPWIEVVDLGAVPDRPADLAAALAAAALAADLVVSTGGMSVGDEDHLPDVARRTGGRIAELRIAMKPGKPLALGALGGAAYLGLPGNPVAAFVGWTMIGARVAERLAGLSRSPRAKLVARAARPLRREPGRCEFRPARLIGYDAGGAQVVDFAAGSFSARIKQLADADGLVLIPADLDEVGLGDLLEFLPFR